MARNVRNYGPNRFIAPGFNTYELDDNNLYKKYIRTKKLKNILKFDLRKSKIKRILKETT